MLRSAAAALFLLLADFAPCQGPPHNGPRPVDTDWFALQNATVVTAPGSPPTQTTVIVRNGLISAVGGPTPAGAVAIDCTGLTIYPGLVEPFLPIDVPSLDASTGDVHWNPMIQPQRHALESAGIAAADRQALRALGFTTAAIAPSGGILKGTSAVVLLDEPTETDKPRVVRPHANVLASLQTSRTGYPDSEMGAIALLRQTLLDAQWYERCAAVTRVTPSLANTAPHPSSALAALNAHWTLPLWFDTQDELQALRVLRIAAEFSRPAVIVGSGMEFRRVQALAAAKAAVVVPLQFPAAPDVSSAAAADQVSLRHLQSWEQAPTNSKRLLDAGVTIAWTTARLRDKKELRTRISEATACGVTAEQALAALTTVPSRLLGIEAHTGTIEPGKLANLVVVQGDLFDPEALIRDVWVGGRRHVIAPAKDLSLDGSWLLSGLPGIEGTASLAIATAKVTLKIGDKQGKLEAVERQPSRMRFVIADGIPGGNNLEVRLRREGDQLVGVASPVATFSDQDNLRATLDAAGKPKEEKPDAGKTAFKPPAIAPLPTPLGGYGLLDPPAMSTFAIVGADVWTCDERGIVPNGAVLVRDGKLAFVGARANMPALSPGTETIDGTGKHVTPGIIDCHSHTGISRGINEGGQAVTAEVRIEDVIDPDDVNWYRQLAGGVTTVNQLHGSANAIGGQSATTKNRWGTKHPGDLLLAQAPPGMKWALGENPRRANGSGVNPRYPNTRMGVEGLLRDRLAAAEAYRRQLAAYTALAPAERAKVMSPRRDLELEALAEIIAGTRRVHCHSYRQDEIFMLCGLAHEYGIKIGTFQHVLEGYKIADAIAANAIGASSFSDWWAYKFEVYDAIPDNGAILHEQGVVVSFNSDSNEHARRLNTEAGKAVKYGGLSPAEALCFVTRNPAIQLGIFERTGSLTAGKDADLALWSGNPLGYASRCEATWVDGRKLFSLAGDRAAREAIASERQRLLARALAGGKRRDKGEADAKDAYWAAEDLTDQYCCRDQQGGR